MHRIARMSNSAARRSAITAADETGMVELRLLGSDFLFSQVTIVSSVATEDDSHLVKQSTAKFINSNGDGWTNESLKANYKSFIGSWNFVNHDQRAEKGVGFIADAALRRVVIDKDSNTFVYYVDLLVATHKATSPRLVEKILSGAIEFLSMGCEAFMSTCSACGHQAEDETDFCSHLERQKGKYFLDRSGKKRITGELLGTDKPGSCVFVEASWLTEPPAFGGACKRHILPVADDKTVIVRMPAAASQKEAVQTFMRKVKSAKR